jgi:alkylation response protein AidB-like acyl-CoA dehydrogenase
MRDFGTEQQKTDWMPGFLDGTGRLAFGLTEPNHGRDATYMETTAVRDGDEWVINGMKRWNSGLHHATHDIIFARTSGDPGSPKGISAFLVPTDAPGFKVEFFWWTFNMPTDHAEVSLTDVRVGGQALFGEVDRGLELAQHFVHENRIRQAASSLGAAQFCVNEAVRYSNERTTWGKKLSTNQGIQFPLVELHTEAAMLRQLVRYTAWMLDQKHHMEVTHLVAMCNYRANRLACDAADRAMQTCGGVGYSRHMPFEHIYRHHRRYRITEGSEEIQMRKVGQSLFGFGRSARPREEVAQSAQPLHEIEFGLVRPGGSSDRRRCGGSCSAAATARRWNAVGELRRQRPEDRRDQDVAGGQGAEFGAVDQSGAERGDHDRELTTSDQRHPGAHPTLRAGTRPPCGVPPGEDLGHRRDDDENDGRHEGVEQITGVDLEREEQEENGREQVAQRRDQDHRPLLGATRQRQPDQERPDCTRDLQALGESGDEQGDPEHGQQQRFVGSTDQEVAQPLAVAQRGEQDHRDRSQGDRHAGQRRLE